MGSPEQPPNTEPGAVLEVPELDWNKCNVCGKHFLKWPKLREHKLRHRLPGADSRKRPPRDGVGSR